MAEVRDRNHEAEAKAAQAAKKASVKPVEAINAASSLEELGAVRAGLSKKLQGNRFVIRAVYAATERLVNV